MHNNIYLGIIMAFRFTESINDGLSRAIRELARIPESGMTKVEICDAENYLKNIVTQIGPVVNGYPVWHPLVSHNCSSLQDFIHIKPSNEQYFNGLDHTVFFAHGLISCPYRKESVNALIQSIENLNNQFGYSIEWSNIPFKLYNNEVIPILVRTDNCYELDNDLTISKKSAIKLFLTKMMESLECRYPSSNWHDFAPCILGTPSGGRSSLFVNQNTGQALKTIFTMFVKQGVILTQP